MVRSASGGRLVLELPRLEACRECGRCAAGAGVMLHETANTVAARAGERVLVSFGLSRLSIASLLFGVPTLILVAGLLIGRFGLGSDLSGFGLGLLGLAGYAQAVRGRFGRVEPRLRRIPADDPPFPGGMP